MVSLGLYIQDFREFTGSPKGQEWLARADEKRKFTQAALSKENFPKLNEDLMKKLLTQVENLSEGEASEILTSLVNKYGLEDFKGEFYYFLYGERPLEERFDEMRKAVPDFPVDALLEIVTLGAPRDFCIWDEAAKQTLTFLGRSRMYGLSENAFLGQISGWEYVHCKSALNHIREQVKSYLQRRVDFVDVHLFSKYMLEKEVSKVLRTVPTQDSRQT